MLGEVENGDSEFRTVAKSEQSSLRIIAGRWKGRRIQFAPEGIRPTADRVRETLFNWLSPFMRDATCLDIFAGTGALGLEALSRGAAKTVFVEQSRQAVSHLKDNITALGCESAEVIKADARKLAYTGRGPFDVVFLDPPFDTSGDSAGLAKLCTLLESAGCLSAGAHIYIEMAKQAELPSLPTGWEVIRERTAGQVRYALIQCQPDAGLAKQQE
jgi:16S rRNA (guanine966-N2)-methyltransferase